MTIRDIFIEYGQAYLNTFGDQVPAHHRKVMQAIIHCRTPHLGAIVCRCEGCGQTYEIFRSCGNRHCPTCQGDKAKMWLAHRLDQLLPVDHFMITFTVPAVFRKFFRSHQRFAYSAFFDATSGAMRKLASENTYFQGDIPGFFGVLHTWGRQMLYHPHIHYIVPGGAFDSNDYSWHSSRPEFYLPIRVLSKLVKHRMYTMVKKEGFLHLLPPDAWQQDWNVNSQAVGNGERSIRYLAAYVFRTAISDKRILDIKDGHVIFRYNDTKTGTEKIMRLKIFEFLRRFLQHVLPCGFMKIRYFGFMHPSSRIPLKVAVAILEAFYGIYGSKNKESNDESRLPQCSVCNAHVRYLYFIPPHRLLATAGFT